MVHRYPHVWVRGMIDLSAVRWAAKLPEAGTAGASRLISMFLAIRFVRALRRLPHLETVALRQQEVLYEADRPISYIHFPRSGVVSLLINLPGRHGGSRDGRP